MTHTRRLILMRHGRTPWNAVGRAQGHADIELDEVGHAQATAAAEQLSHHRLSALWSSDLTRAKQTCEYVAAATGLEVRHDERFREFDVGAREGLTLPEFAERFPDAFEEWSSGGSLVAVLDGETGADVHDRMVPALQECLRSLDEGETGLVLTHGAALKVGLLGLLGWPLDSYRDLVAMDNCSWATVETSGRGERVRLVGYNQNPPRGPLR